MKSKVEHHYYRSNLFEDILARLEELDTDLNNVQRKDIANVDEFHVRGAQVSMELAQSINMENPTLLDVGCGIGGPCRMLAAEHNCTVTGIDLSEEYIRTAAKLSELVGLSDKTAFIYGNATDLPFDDKSFDVVWTQHVQMNVFDKLKFYSEIQRVLTNDGIFMYYDIFKTGSGKVEYPMPWANESEISFLQKTNEMEKVLNHLSFRKIKSTTQTELGIEFFENLLKRIEEFGPPKLGLNVLMGETTKPKIVNLLNALKEEKLVLESGIYRK